MLRLHFYPESQTLVQPAKIIECITSDTRLLAEQMFTTMIANMGVGLAAPQVGVAQRMFVMVGTNDMEVVINPDPIIPLSDNKIALLEGCLSLPGLYDNVERYSDIRVRYQQLDGSIIQRDLEGFEARVFQHEYDHLDGWLFPFYKIPNAKRFVFNPLVVGSFDYKKLAHLEMI